MKTKILLYAFFFIIFNYSLLITNCIIFAQNLKPEVVVQIGHTGKVNSVCFSPEGKYALSGSDDCTLKLWDIRTGKELRTFIGHIFPVLSVAFSSDGNYSISGGMDKNLKLWDISSGKEIRTFTGHSSEVSTVTFSPDGKYILSGSWDKTIKLWEINTMKELKTFTGHNGKVLTIAFSPDGKYALTGSSDNTLKLWDIKTGNEVRTMSSGQSDGVSSVAFSPDGYYAVSGNRYGKIILWQLSTGNKIRTFGEDNYRVNSVMFTPDGKFILSGIEEYDFTDILLLWDVSTGKKIKTLESSSSVKSVAVSQSGKYAISGGDDNNLKLWDILSGKEIQSFSGSSNSAMSVEYLSDDKLVLSGSQSGSINFWDLTTGEGLKTYRVHKGPVSSVSYSKSEKYVLSGSWDKTLKICDISSGINLKTFKRHKEEIYAADFSPDGKYVLSGSWDKTLKLWDISTGEEIKTFNGHNGPVLSVAFSPNGKYALSGSDDCTLKLWDISTGEEIKTFNGHNGPVLSVAFSSDGEKIISGGADSNIILWSINTGEVMRTFKGHFSIVNSVSFSQDNKYALSGSWDKTIKTWDISLGKELQTFIGHRSGVLSVAFSLDGKFALSGSFDNTIKIWDVESGKEIVSLISYGEKDYLYITPDNYYLCSKGGLDAIAFVIDNQAYPPEQFDLQYNRPDIVLERIGLADPELIKAYREAYYKRLRKLNFKEEWFKPDFYMPELKIENKDEFDGNESKNRNIKLKISAKDEKGNLLDRINVYVNGVPIYGTNGIDIRDENLYNIENKEIEIPLNDSVNKIEVSVLNHAGVESLKDNLELTYAGNKEEPKTYFIGIGVSEYQDKSWKLNFASKDIRDLAEVYKNRAIIDTLIDEQATRDNILMLKEKLLKTNVNDEVIIALSGHGILNSKYDFYYATWDMDFQNPEKNGLLFDDLDKLLDSIPARKKVLLIDACNSGEIDKEIVQNEELAKQDKNEKEKEKNKGDKGDIPDALKKARENSKLGLKNSFELMQEIFVNLTRGNGAVVISAARGYESALEDISYGSGNGAFTACILELFNSKKPGEHIKVSELKEYVIKRVEELTNGSQKPTSRRENLAYDFLVW